MPIKLPFQKFVLTFLMSVGLFVFGHAQQLSGEVEELYNHTEKIYSTDDLLVNGQIYIPKRSIAKGNPYFGENHFSKGMVIIKGRKFDGVLLKYNLEDQRLILRAALESGKYMTILLNSNLVDAFSVGEQDFINAGSYYNNAGFSGFYSLVYKGSFTCLIEYEKTFIAIYDTRTPNGSYTEMKSEYFIFEDGKLENVTKKKALLNYFPTYKKEIKSFIRKYKIQYKKANLDALHQLMKYCDSISADK